MAELGKVPSCKELGRDLDEILLVVDATQDKCVISRRLFGDCPITGIALTKLDSTARRIILALNEPKFSYHWRGREVRTYALITHSL